MRQTLLRTLVRILNDTSQLLSRNGTVAHSKIFIRFCQSKPHIRSTTNIKVCLWVQRQTPGCIFIPRLSRDSLHFSCFRRVAIFKKDLLSVPMRCTAFHFLALVMRRSGVRFSSRAPYSVGFWVAIRTPSVLKTTQNAYVRPVSGLVLIYYSPECVILIPGVDAPVAGVSIFVSLARRRLLNARGV